MSSKIFLIGLPGAGKTTIGLDLSVHLGVPFVDLDLEIEKDTKQSINELFEHHGEAHFRQLEKTLLEKSGDEIKEFVMATGGGTPCFFDNLAYMKATGTVFFIDTPMDTIVSRLKHDTTRPLLMTQSLAELYEKRKGWYNQADHTIRNYKEILQFFS